MLPFEGERGEEVKVVEVVPIREMVLEEVKAMLGLCLPGPVIFRTYHCRHLHHPHIPSLYYRCLQSQGLPLHQVCVIL